MTSCGQTLCQAVLKAFCSTEISKRCCVPLLIVVGLQTDNLCMQAIIETFRDEETGGRVYACMVGSAPSAPEVVHFLRTALVAPILESFGSTETGEASPAGTA